MSLVRTHPVLRAVRVSRTQLAKMSSTKSSISQLEYRQDSFELCGTLVPFVGVVSR